MRRAGRRGEQLKHHKKASEDRCPAELDTVKHSEVMWTGEKAVRERGGDHQRTSLAQERHKGSAWGRGSTPRSPCASKTRDLRGAVIKGVPRAPLYLELPDVQAEGGLAEITHAHMHRRGRTHAFGPTTEANTHARTPGAIKVTTGSLPCRPPVTEKRHFEFLSKKLIFPRVPTTSQVCKPR